MKFVQSLYFFKDKDHTFWRNSETDISIWKLSNLYLNRIGVKCEFWGCDQGIKFAKDAGLRFHNIEKIPELNIHSRFWSSSKIYVASQQTEPFLHLDGDVFLKKWDMDNLPDFLVQNHEGYSSEKGGHWFYAFCSFLYRNGGSKIAEYIYDLSLIHGTNIFNFGIFGGSNIQVPKVCANVFEICNQLSGIADKIPSAVFVPCVVEQILIPLFLMEKRISITTYLNENINKDAENKGYCHLLGPIKKKKETIQSVKDKIKLLMSECAHNNTEDVFC